MRFLFWLLGLAAYVIALVVSCNHYETEFTRTTAYPAALVEKWEDWSNDNQPYNALFLVKVRNVVVEEETELSARSFRKAEPNSAEFNWTVQMSPKKAGAKPTMEEYRTWKDSVSTFWWLTGGFGFYTLLLIIWVVRDPWAFE